MAFQVFDRVKETTATTGSGTISLAGASYGFQSFDNALSSGDTTYYAIENGSQWETGFGTYSGNTLSRDTVFESSNSGQLIILSGTSNVFITYPASKSVYRNTNNQVVLTSSGLLFSNGSVQTVASSGNVYTAGTGLQLVGYEFNIDSTVLQSGDNISLLVNDSGYITSESDTLQLVTDRGSNTSNDITSSGTITATSGVFDILSFTAQTGIAHTEGVLFYDNDNKSLTFFNDEADISLQIGQEEYIRVRNNTGSTITNGQLVKILGSQGSNPTIELAIANTKDSSHAIGMATHDIEDSTFGYITTFGLVNGISTSGYAQGVELYLSTSSSGAYTDTEATGLNYNTAIGHVIRSHATNGSILFTPSQPRLAGNEITSNGEIPSISGIGFFSNSSSVGSNLTSNSSLVYDSGNNRVGIGTSTPSYTLDVNGTGNFLALRFSDGTVQTTEAVVSGDNVSLLVNDAGYLTSHPSIAAASSSDNSGRTYIQDILLDSNGHITGIATATETVVDTDTTYTAGTGLQLVGTEFNIDSTVIQSGDNVSLLVNDANYVNGTGVNQRIAIWSDSDTINSDSNFTWDGSTLNIIGSVTVSSSVEILGGASVSGTLTYINSENVTIYDKQLELASNSGVAVSGDAYVNDGGIVLKSSDSDKKFTWIDATDAWTSTEHIALNQNKNIILNSGGAIQFSDATTQITAGVVSGDNISLLTNDAGYITAHPAVSAASSSDNSGRTYIQDLLFDSFGHVTGVATATETVTDTDTTYTAGSGLTLNSTVFDVNVNNTVQVTAPESVSSTANRTYAVQVDASDNLVVNVPWESGAGGSGDITSVVAGTGLSGGGTSGDVTLNIDDTVIQSGDNISLLTNDSGYLTTHPAISAASSSDNSGRTYIQDILLDSFGHVTGIATAIETVTSSSGSYLESNFTNQTGVNVVHNFGGRPVVAVTDNNGEVLIPYSITHNTVNDFTVVFSETTTGYIQSTFGSPQVNAFISVNSPYTVLSTDSVVKNTLSSNTVTLLTAVSNAGKIFRIKNASAGTCTIDTTSSQTIDGQLTISLESNESLDVCSDGANWIII